MIWKKYSIIFLIFNSLFACTKKSEKGPEQGQIKLGMMSGPEASIAHEVAKVAKTKFNIDIKVIEFDDYSIPNIALNEGSIDANAFQSVPFLNDAKKHHGYKISEIAKTFLFPLAAYSKKIKSISELKNHAKIALPNDPTQEGRSLALLHDAGLIKLKDRTNILSNLTDIISNPNNYKFYELNAAQLIRSMDDCDLSIVNSTFAVEAGLTPEKDGLIRETPESPWVNYIVVKDSDREKPWVRSLIKAFQQQEIKDASAKIFKGSAIAGW